MMMTQIILSAAVDGPQFFLNYFPILDMRVILT